MGYRSIHTRMVAQQSLLVAVVLAIFSAIVYQRVGASLRQTLDTAIRCQADYACYVLRTGAGRLPSELGAEIVSHPDLPPESRIVRILSPAGQELYVSPLAHDHPIGLDRATHAHAARGLPVFEHMRTGVSVLRVATVPAVVDGRITAIVQVATATDHLRDSLARLRLLLVTISLVALFAAAPGGYFLSRAALRPVAWMTDMVREISIGNLSARVPVPPTGDEVERLGDTFNEMLTHIEAAVGQMRRFTADASHELRTPLTALKGEVEVALRRVRSREALEEVLRSVLQEARHMSHTVEDMLTLARLDSGDTGLRLSPVPLRSLARQAVQRHLLQADAVGCQLSLAPGPDLSVHADEHYLMQLLDNLLSNALRHTPPGGHVTVTVDVDGSRALLSVSDDGEGISPENLERVFDRFFTTRKGERKGTGLGLSICRWIARAHGGDIQVQSRLAQGSTFTVRLPLG